MISMPDPDCNQVQLSLTDPNITARCTLPEGHPEPCGSLVVMTHKHRTHVQTVTDPFRIRLGGVHRRTAPGEQVADGPTALDAMLRARQPRTTELRRRLAFAGGAR